MTYKGISLILYHIVLAREPVLGGDSAGKEEYKYHILEGPIETNRNKRESRECHEYHILEGPLPKKEGNDKIPQMQAEGSNVYHVLEGPTSRDENDT